MKNIFIIPFFLMCAAPLPTHAIITYGQSNSDAAVNYDSTDNAALTSVVAIGSGSAVYVGNGWFLTANHVSINTSSTILQNGNSASVSYIDNTLKSNLGVDLKLFYVSEYSSLTNLTSVNLSASANASLLWTSFGYKRSGNIISGYTYSLTYTSGTQLTLAGAGFGRDEATGLTDETVSSNGIKGEIHTGASTLMSTQDSNGVTMLITMAEKKERFSSGTGRRFW